MWSWLPRNSAWPSATRALNLLLMCCYAMLSFIQIILKAHTQCQLRDRERGVVIEHNSITHSQSMIGPERYLLSVSLVIMAGEEAFILLIPPTARRQTPAVVTATASAAKQKV